MIPIQIRPVIYQRGTGGAPSSSVVILDVIGAMSSYQQAINVTGGFESCVIKLTQNLDDALDWLNNLMASIVVYGPDAQVVWEGYLNSVDLSVGDERISLSLDDMANAVKVRYQPGVGAQVSTATTTDAESIATYGRKDLVYGGSGMTPTAATALRDLLLESRRQPKAQRAGGSASGEAASDVQITLSFAGWYYALDWLVTSSATTATAVTTTQLTTLLAAYNAVNAFYGTNYINITASGVSDTQYIEPDTPYREKIERLLSLGDSSGERLAYGVYEDRTWKVAQWAGADPSTITYYRNLGDSRIFAAGGSVVAPWDVRPDAMYQVVDLVDPSLPTGAIDQTSAFYVERVTCSIDESGVSVRLEPAKSSELDVLLARIK